MNADPSVNVIVFEVIDAAGVVNRAHGEAQAREARGVEIVWKSLSARDGGLDGARVQRLHADWEPSREDLAFIRENFQATKITYSFKRPAREEDWGEALAAAGREIEQSLRRGLDERVGQVTRDGELLPVLRKLEPAGLWAQTVVHRAIGAGLAVFAAHVALTPRKTIGFNWLMMREAGDAADAQVATACENLARGLKVERRETEDGVFFVVRHPLHVATAALALPGFHEKAAQWAGAEELFVAFTCPDELVVTAMKNAELVRELRRAVATASANDELPPAGYALTAGGLAAFTN
jgi:hypothetical protein